MSNFLRFASLALAAALGCQSAAARVEGSASLTGIAFELVDLTPDDGIAPTLEWQYNNPLARVDTMVRVNLDDTGFHFEAKNAFSTFSNTVDLANGHAHGEVSPTHALSEGWVESPYAPGVPHNSEFLATANPAEWQDFRLSPGTELKVSAYGSLSAAVTSPMDPDSRLEESARAWAILGLVLGTTEVVDSKEIRLSNQEGPTSQGFDGWLHASISNQTDQWALGLAFVGTNTGGTSDIVAIPVPEPSTFALSLFGLAVLGFAVCRKRRLGREGRLN